MANFITDNTPLPSLKVDANPPVNPTQEVDAADLNNIWAALGDVRAALATEQPINYVAPLTGAVSRTIPSKLADTTSVRDFNAKGDGVADDTAAIQAAITAAIAAGKAVYIPAGTYVISSTINITATGLTIRGDGYLSVLRPTISDLSPVLNFTSSSNFLLADFVIVSAINPANFWAGTASAQQCTGIKTASSVTRFEIRNVTVAGVKVGYDIGGYIVTGTNVWAANSEVGLKGDQLNAADLNLRMEGNRQNFAITNSLAVLFRQLLAEGANVNAVASTIDSSSGVTLQNPYFEGSATAPRSVPFLTVGGTTVVNQFKIVGASIASSSGFATGVYPISLDRVTGVDINGSFSDGGTQGRKVLTTTNTVDYRLSGNTVDWHTDASNQIGPAFNYFPNRRFDLWFRGWNAVLTGATNTTMTKETAITRGGANAMRVTANAGATSARTRFEIVGPVVTALRGKTVRAGVWMWIPNITPYDESARLQFPSITLESYNGTATVTSATQNNISTRNAWNYLTASVAVQSDATTIFIATYANQGGAASAGTEYVVVSSITLTDVATPLSRQMNDDLIDSPLIPAIGVGGRMIASGTAIPTDVVQAYVQGDVVWNSAAAAAGIPGWVCTTGGSPGTWKAMAVLAA